MDQITAFFERAEKLIERLERVLPPAAAAAIDWKETTAARWRKRNGAGFLQAVGHPHGIHLDDLQNIDKQKDIINRNTRQFLHGLPANNVLMTGARGTGKSSLVKAMLNEYAKDGLRLIEVDKTDLVDLPDLVDQIADQPYRFVLFCDDLSFEANDPAYKALKTILDGSVAAQSDNVVVYATSNRRHLMPEFMSENLEYTHVGEEIHPGETAEEKISLSERFGLWIPFYPFNQDNYLTIVDHWLRTFKLEEAQIAASHAEALRFALARGSRSGRVAWQFARDYAGQVNHHD